MPPNKSQMSSPAVRHCPDKQIVSIQIMWCMEKREKPLRHLLPLMIFDHSHRILRATHLLQLCCQDVMSTGSISFNYSHFSSIYTSAARSVLCTEILCSWEIIGKMCFFFSAYTKSSVFTNLSRATTSHLVCCCIKLWHQPVLIVSRPGKGWVFIFIFRFLAQVWVARHPAKADNEKRCMMSCRQSDSAKSLVTKFPGSYHFPPLFPLLSFPLLCPFSVSLQGENLGFFLFFR